MSYEYAVTVDSPHDGCAVVPSPITERLSSHREIEDYLLRPYHLGRQRTVWRRKRTNADLIATSYRGKWEIIRRVSADPARKPIQRSDIGDSLRGHFERGKVDGDARRAQHPEAMVIEAKDALRKLKILSDQAAAGWPSSWEEFYWRGRVAGLVGID